MVGSMRFADYSILGSDWGIWTLLGGMTAMLRGVVKKRTRPSWIA